MLIRAKDEFCVKCLESFFVVEVSLIFGGDVEDDDYDDSTIDAHDL